MPRRELLLKSLFRLQLRGFASNPANFARQIIPASRSKSEQAQVKSEHLIGTIAGETTNGHQWTRINPSEK
jgi:hypothetical protein